MHKDDGSGIRVQTLPQAANVQCEAARLTVREPHAPAGMDDRRGCREERIGWDDYFAVLDADSPQDYLQRAGAAVYGDGVWDTAEGGELLLELPAVLPESQCSGRQ